MRTTLGGASGSAMRYDYAVRWFVALLLASFLVACSDGPSPRLEAHEGGPDLGTEHGEVRAPDMAEEVETLDADIGIVGPALDTEATLRDATQHSERAGDSAGVEGENGPDETSLAPEGSDEVQGGEADATDAASEVGPQPVPPGASPGRAPMRRLTRHELDNTIHQLTGVQGVARKTLPPEPETQGFDNHVDSQSVGPSFVEGLMIAAEHVAQEADLSALLPCDAEVLGALECGALFVTHLGRQVFRRPMSVEQQGRFQGLFEEALEAWGFEEAARLVLSAMLMSPQLDLHYAKDQEQDIQRKKVQPQGQL